MAFRNLSIPLTISFTCKSLGKWYMGERLEGHPLISISFAELYFFLFFLTHTAGAGQMVRKKTPLRSGKRNELSPATMKTMEISLLRFLRRRRCFSFKKKRKRKTLSPRNEKDGKFSSVVFSWQVSFLLTGHLFVFPALFPSLSGEMKKEKLVQRYGQWRRKEVALKEKICALSRPWTSSKSCFSF